MIIYNNFKIKAVAGFPALKHKNFRYFLWGQSVSLMGTWMQKAAQQWVIYEITKSPFILGLVGVFQFTPMLMFSLYAGVLVDRFSKKKFLMVTQSIQMIQALVLAVLLWSGYIQYWHILIMSGILGLANTFDMPTRQSFFIELVGKEDLVSAIGLNSTIVNVARIIGPAIGGILLAYFGAAVCFLANGLSFIFVLIGLHRIESYNTNIRVNNKDILRDIIDGLIYVSSNRVILNAILSMLIVGTIAMNSDVIMPVFATEVLKQQADGYSLMLSAMGIGSLIGSLFFASNIACELGKRRLYQCGVMLSICLISTSFLHNYYLALFSLAGVGLFSMIFMAMVNSTIQLNTSDEYRGRVMGVLLLVFNGVTPIGNFFTGLGTQKYGSNISFFICGAISAVLLTLLYVVRRGKLNRGDD